jgi:hypothetical protein
MDILEMVAIEIPCRTCGGRYEVSLKKIALSQQMLHDGCPDRAETECPPSFPFRLRGPTVNPGSSKDLVAPGKGSSRSQRGSEVALRISRMCCWNPFGKIEMMAPLEVAKHELTTGTE